MLSAAAAAAGPGGDGQTTDAAAAAAADVGGMWLCTGATPVSLPGAPQRLIISCSVSHRRRRRELGEPRPSTPRPAAARFNRLASRPSHVDQPGGRSSRSPLLQLLSVERLQQQSTPTSRPTRRTSPFANCARYTADSRARFSNVEHLPPSSPGHLPLPGNRHCGHLSPT